RDDQNVHDVHIVRWREPFEHGDAADVIIEAFGCGLPETYVTKAAARESKPQWFVLEYLSAEPWVDDMHGLRSPHPRLPLARRFWFPGFTARTGGLLRERDLTAARDAFQSNALAERQWWRSIDIDRGATAGIAVSLFCYPNRALPELLDAWADG